MDSPLKVGVMDHAWHEEHTLAKHAAQQAGLPRRFLDAHRFIPVARSERGMVVATPQAGQPLPELPLLVAPERLRPELPGRAPATVAPLYERRAFTARGAG